eukprot:TRINITY_DN3398_c0_g1_i2.p1 TRINITY_DN3398_c0_g1~~TRINITY_DN3398_c0_g1_i2.p1  ORF type:complete len:1792 (+),score=322.68 TRINITY_DN3398_c0_g1_i2:62-5437(+)
MTGQRAVVWAALTRLCCAELLWTDVRQLGVRGQGFPAAALDSWADRLPAAAKDVVRDEIWLLQRDSAGLYVDFESNDTALFLRITYVYSIYSMYNFPSTGVSGMDLYGWDRAQAMWQWVGTTYINVRPTETNMFTVYPDLALADGHRRYRLLFPTYNAPLKLSIGHRPGALRAAQPPPPQAPVVWYGTSIVQGAASSRPGMILTHQISRSLGREILNFGFAGNCFMEEEVAQFLVNVTHPPAAFILDCSWNMRDDAISARAGPLLRMLRRALGPDTPIVVAEDTAAGDRWVQDPGTEQELKWKALRSAYDAMAPTDRNLHYVAHWQLYNFSRDSGHPTVDGVHPSDLGMTAIADFYTAFLPGVLRDPRPSPAGQRQSAAPVRGTVASASQNAMHRHTVEVGLRTESAGLPSQRIPVDEAQWYFVASEFSTSEDERHARPLACGRDPPLERCPNRTCPAVDALLDQLFRDDGISPSLRAAVCAHPSACLIPLIDTAKNNPNVTMPPQLSNTTAGEFCSPTCSAKPPVGDGEPRGACAPAQIATGLQCCDDPRGDLRALGSSCLEVVVDVWTDCYLPVNARLRAVGRCPADPGGGEQREVRELCPRRCRNVQHPGCDCPNAHDRGCPALNCLVPDEGLYGWGVACDHCVVTGANLHCTEPFNPVRFGLKVVMWSVVAVMLAVLAVYVVRVAPLPAEGLWLNRRRGPLAESLDCSSGLTAPASTATCSACRLVDRYRVQFERGCYNVGWFLASHSGPLYFGILAVLVWVCACGVPQAQIDRNPTLTDWAPDGGQLARQLEYYNRWTTKGSQFSEFFLMVGPEDQEGDSALRGKYLEATHRLLDEIKGLRVAVPRGDGKGEVLLGYEDFCLRLPDNPVLRHIYPGETPCIHPGPLDCFFEGAWQIENVSSGAWPARPSDATRTLDKALVTLNAIFGNLSVIDNYYGRPSYRNLSDADIRLRLSDYPHTTGGCRHWHVESTLKRGMAFGGATLDPPASCSAQAAQQRTEMAAANFLVTVPQQVSADAARLVRPRLEGVLPNDLAAALEAWRREVSDLLEAADGDERRYPGTRISVVFSTFHSDVFKELPNTQLSLILGCYLLMGGVTFFESGHRHPIDNLAPVAAAYLLLVVSLSTVAAYGILAASGAKYNHLMLHVVPFLSISLGAGDMFLVLHYFRQMHDKCGGPTADTLGGTLRGAARPVTLTALTNLTAFLGGSAAVLPALRNCLVLGGLVVLCNYVSALVVLPLMLARWVDKHRLSKPYSSPSPEDSPGADGDGSKTSFQLLLLRLSPVTQQHPLRLAVLGIWAALLVFFLATLSTIAPIAVDFQIVDFARSGTHFARGVSDFLANVYSQLYQHEWLVEVGDGGDGRPNVADPETQVALQNTAARLLAGFSPESDGLQATHWLYGYMEFAEKYNASWVHKTDYHTGAPVETGCLPSCMNATMDNSTECAARGQCGRYRPGNAWWVAKEHFWEVFHNWRHPVLGGAHAVAAFTRGLSEWGYTAGVDPLDALQGCQEAGCNKMSVPTLVRSEFAADTRCVRSPADWQGHTRRVRQIIAEDFGEYAYPRPAAKFFDAELIEATQNFFWITLGIGVGGVFLGGFVVAVSFRGLVIIALSGLAGLVELIGLVMLLGVDLTATAAVSIVMALGVSVSPAVQAVAAYEHCEERGREQRAHHCVHYSTAPIVKGSLSAMFSFVMMAFSPFPYVHKSSFLPLFVAACVGLVHGTVFVPAVLGVVGASGVIAVGTPQEEGEGGLPRGRPHPYAPEPAADVDCQLREARGGLEKECSILALG